MAFFGAIKEAVAGALQPLADVIDELNVSEEEKTLALAKLTEAKAKLEESANDIVRTEADHEHWYVAGWRPTFMYVFLVIVLLDSTPWVEMTLADQVWPLMQYGLTGYVVARGGEKIAKTLARRKPNEAPVE